MIIFDLIKILEQRFLYVFRAIQKNVFNDNLPVASVSDIDESDLKVIYTCVGFI